MKMKIKKGRIGQWNEYVEFQKPSPRYIAQRGNSGFWFVFKVSLETVITLTSFKPKEKEKAIAYAKKKCCKRS